LLLAPVFALPPNGARIPSIADDVATDLVTVRSRTSGLHASRGAECQALLIEPRGVVNTGATGAALTAPQDVWI
jgi:hypothetical protein